MKRKRHPRVILIILITIALLLITIFVVFSYYNANKPIRRLDSEHLLFSGRVVYPYKLIFPSFLGEPQTHNFVDNTLVFQNNDDPTKNLYLIVRNSGRGGITAGVQLKLKSSVKSKITYNTYLFTVNTYEITETLQSVPEFTKGKFLVEGILQYINDPFSEELLYMKITEPLNADQLKTSIDIMTQIANSYREN